MSTMVRVTPADFAPPAIIDRMRMPSLIVGVVCGILAIIGGFVLGWETFLQAWLVGFMFWLGITLGSLALLCLQYTSGGNWGRLGRRFWEAATTTLPLMFLFWLPLAFGLSHSHLYPWVTESKEHMSNLELNRALLLFNSSAFIIR